MKNNKSILRSAAVDDVKSAFLRSQLWLYLGWSDIQQRYRGSVLGPFWITLTMMFFVTALGVVYGRLFHQDVNTFLPFLSAGILIWTYVSTVLIESSDVFIFAKSLIEVIRLPYMCHVLRLVWRNQIVFFHNLVVFIVIALYFRVGFSWNTLLFIPGVILVSLLLVSMSLCIAMLGSRFRDLPPVISSLIMIIFFVSPVTWKANMLGAQSYIVRLNPVYYIMDIVRSPLLGEAPAIESWFVCVGLLVVCFFVSFNLFARFRSRIPFWI